MRKPGRPTHKHFNLNKKQKVTTPEWYAYRLNETKWPKVLPIFTKEELIKRVKMLYPVFKKNEDINAKAEDWLKKIPQIRISEEKWNKMQNTQNKK